MALPLILPLLAGAGAAAGAGLGYATGVGKVKRGASSFYDPDGSKGTGYNPNASDWGGYAGGVRDYSANLNSRRNEVENRAAFQADYGQANADRARGLQARTGAMSMADLIAARARGEVPSVAQMQADRQMGQAVAAQNAQAASARGGAATALAQQTAANNISNAQSAISNSAQINAAQERERAEANAVGAFQGIRSGDQSSEGLAGQRAQFNTQMQQHNRDANDTRAMGYEQLESNAQQAQLNAKMQQQGQLAASHGNAEQLNTANAQHNAATDKSFFDKFLPSDANAKLPLPILSDIAGKIPGLGLGAPPGVGGGIDIGSKGSMSGEDVKQASTGLASAAPMPGMVGGGGITGGSVGGLGMPQGGGMGGGGLLGFFSDTRAKKSALLARGRREGAAIAMRGGPSADAMLDDRQMQFAGRVAAPDGIGRDELDRSIGAQVEQDRADADIDRQLEEQKAEDARRSRDPAVGLGRAPKGYAKQREAEPRESLAGERAAPNTRMHLAPGTEDFDRTEPKKDAKTPWWMTPVNPSDLTGLGFFSDDRAKLAAAWDEGRQAAIADVAKVAKWSPEQLKSSQDPLARAVRETRASAWDEGAGARGKDVEGVRRKSFEEGAAHATKALTGEEMRPWSEDDEPEDPYKDYVAPPGPHPLPPPPPAKTPEAEANRAMVGSAYAYKPGLTPPTQKPGEPNFGPMAQNLEKSPVAATAVKQDPTTGLKVLDRDKLLKVVASGVADLQRQQDQTRSSMQRLRASSGGRRRR